jgi:CelD/BcsL family acetyltransferase involved in cellulose biosynthesis
MNETSLKIEKIDSLNSLETIKNVWNSLLKKSVTQTIELTYEWQMAFWQQFNQGAELFVLVIREGGSIIAISPLKLIIKRVLGIKIRSLEIIAAQTSNYQDLIIGRSSEDVLVCILDYLVTSQGSWDRLSLRNIPETSPTARFFSEKLGDYPFRRITETDQCAYLVLDESWEEHNKNLGKHRRHILKNKKSRIEKEIGQFLLRRSATDDQLISDLQVFYDSHRKRWDRTNTPSIFWDPRYCKFYSKAGLQLFHKGQLGLSVLEAGGLALAHLIYFTYGQNVLFQLVTYDPDYYKYSPTVVLLEQFIEDGPANAIDEIDWGTYYPWKEPWVNHFKNKVHLTVFPKRILPSTDYSITKLYLALRSRIRQHPRILTTIKNIFRKVRILKWFSSQGTE